MLVFEKNIHVPCSFKSSIEYERTSSDNLQRSFLSRRESSFYRNSRAENFMVIERVITTHVQILSDVVGTKDFIEIHSHSTPCIVQRPRAEDMNSLRKFLLYI